MKKTIIVTISLLVMLIATNIFAGNQAKEFKNIIDQLRAEIVNHENDYYQSFSVDQKNLVDKKVEKVKVVLDDFEKNPSKDLFAVLDVAVQDYKELADSLINANYVNIMADLMHQVATKAKKELDYDNVKDAIGNLFVAERLKKTVPDLYKDIYSKDQLAGYDKIIASFQKKYGKGEYNKIYNEVIKELNK